MAIMNSMTPSSANSPTIAPVRPEIHYLTVSRAIGSKAYGAFLRVQGVWLERAGFEIGMKVRAKVSHKRLVLEIFDPLVEAMVQANEELATSTADREYSEHAASEVMDHGIPSSRRPKRPHHQT